MRKIIVLLGLLVMLNAWADITVPNADGEFFTLNEPAKRVIALSPHITELLFAAGAGNRVIGVSQHSDFPNEAKHIRIIGDNRDLDIERIVALRPDLIVVWQKGSSAKQIEQLKKLRKLNVRLFVINTERLRDIPDNIETLGQLMGTDEEAHKAANTLRRELDDLNTHYAHLSPVRLFFQAWDVPLFTVNGQQIISDAIRLCGGVNIFADQKTIAPRVGIEAILKENPEAIVGAKDQNAKGEGVLMWKRYPMLMATQRNNLYEIDSDLINRAGPRMILGAAQLCKDLDLARGKRAPGANQSP